jgi:enoyl-CoA hydratase
MLLINEARLKMFPRNLDELRELALTSFTREGRGPFGPHRSVLLTKDVLEQLRLAPDHERVVKSLTTLPCPVIGVGPDPLEPDLYAVCDVVVTSDLDVSSILANIDRSPLAAMILVQVLRATSVMPIGEGLTLESLAYGTLQAGPENRAWLRSRKLTP